VLWADSVIIEESALASAASAVEAGAAAGEEAGDA
jgi:hypothetical protein